MDPYAYLYDEADHADLIRGGASGSGCARYDSAMQTKLAVSSVAGALPHSTRCSSALTMSKL
jgi:hypothetical protein